MTDCMSAYGIALCVHINQMIHDGTDMKQVALLAARMLVVLDEGAGEFDVDVMLRRAFVALGKTAEHELDLPYRGLRF